MFVVAAGSYLLAAFEDVNADGNYDPDEPLLGALKIGSFDVAAGQTQRFDLSIPTRGRAVTRVDRHRRCPGPIAPGAGLDEHRAASHEGRGRRPVG